VPSGIGISVWLDRETHDLLIKAVERLETRSGQRMTSGQVVNIALTEWMSLRPPLTD
jgi:hypothetical protein